VDRSSRRPRPRARPLAPGCAAGEHRLGRRRRARRAHAGTGQARSTLCTPVGSERRPRRGACRRDSRPCRGACRAARLPLRRGGAPQLRARRRGRRAGRAAAGARTAGPARRARERRSAAARPGQCGDRRRGPRGGAGGGGRAHLPGARRRRGPAGRRARRRARDGLVLLSRADGLRPRPPGGAALGRAEPRCALRPAGGAAPHLRHALRADGRGGACRGAGSALCGAGDRRALEHGHALREGARAGRAVVDRRAVPRRREPGGSPASSRCSRPSWTCST
jgi:hypothetical protein